jgi:hypothetical protein
MEDNWKHDPLLGTNIRYLISYDTFSYIACSLQFASWRILSKEKLNKVRPITHLRKVKL